MDSAESQPEVRSPSHARSVFFGDHGVRAGWRFAGFILLFVAILRIVQFGLLAIPGFRAYAHSVQNGPLDPLFQILSEALVFLSVLLATAIMARAEKRPLGTYGLPLQGVFGKFFWQGILWGLIYQSLEMLVIHLLGGFSLGSLALASSELVKYAILWGVGFVLVGFSEEYLFRGYSQFTLTTGMGFWPAAFVLSAIFGVTHLSNPGEGKIGALSVMIFGLFACFSLRRTGNLWFAVGFHAATDFAETFIYSVPDSGLLAKGHLLNSSLHGPAWLTGGTIGPEGSVVDFFMLALAFAIFHFAYPSRPKQTNA